MGISLRVFGITTQAEGAKIKRSRQKTFVACEPLEGRQVLSTVSPVVAAAFSSVPPAAVTTAADILQAKAPQAFPAFESGLAQAEASSRVTPAQVDALATDESGLDHGINSAGLSPADTASRVGLVQDEIDGGFLGTVRRSDLAADLRGTDVSPQLVNKTVADMKRVARAANLSPPLHSALAGHEAAIASALGAKPSTDLGAGAGVRDPLTVYINSQVTNFVR